MLLLQFFLAADVEFTVIRYSRVMFKNSEMYRNMDNYHYAFLKINKLNNSSA